MKECQLCKNCFTDEVNTCPNDGMPTYHSISGEPVLEGKYHLECRLGQGGMGVVYKARHAYLKTAHAIKVILPDLVGNDPQLVTRFRQEALAAAAIRHQNVVGVSDYGVAMGTMPFLVMEYVEGESLHDLLTREQKLSPERALDLMSAIAAGVGAAHHQGIVHRDLKPLNVMILKSKTNIAEAVKILDFGLAKIKSGELLGSFIQAQTTGLMGSPYYMAPEQWADEEPDARSDIYSLGVMLFQMLAGDVPFKGSSIPAIMKKHLSDQVPPLSNFGVQIPPQVEMAVRHTLEKQPENRTASVEQMVGELRAAIGVASPNITASAFVTNTSLPISTLNILTNPPQSEIFVDNVSVGQSRADGWLLLEGLQSGNHHVRVKREGFQNWENEIVCDGKPQSVVAELKAEQIDVEAIPKPTLASMVADSRPLRQNTAQNLSATQGAQTFNQQTPQQTWQSPPSVAVESEPKKQSFFSPLVLAVIGISGLLLLAIIGVGGLFAFGFIGHTPVSTNGNKDIIVVPNNSNILTAQPPVPKSEMVKIPGGKFKMGRNDGGDFEKPEHEITVKDFWMDKTEVTTGEYYDFVKATDYKPTPANWEEGKPLASDMLLPIRYVNLNDVRAFAEWRSKRDSIIYRLPTEEEWEYAARNGSDNNLYPWGDSFKNGCAVVDQTDTKPEPVGSKPCGANKWGVVDLIGNVYEWTSTETFSYPGNPLEVDEKHKNTFVFRGGSAYNKSTGKNAITSTYRGFIDPTKRDAQLGFRLVRSEH
ncbi:MAG: SUMF1/EgtB/PvdO family nonheme iron enzyme [Acidobacteriota bacterium]|nr:SUMF1/EgtB/PvdO family nonheme iron enzyme [Acidobacteriota bacterium]